MKKALSVLLAVVMMFAAIPAASGAGWIDSDYTDHLDNKNITQVKVTVTPPQAGKRFPLSAGISGTGFEKVSTVFGLDYDVEWYDKTDDCFIAADEFAVKGHQYEAQIELAAKPGYRFNKNASQGTLTKYYLNNNDVTSQTCYYNDLNIIVCYTFPALPAATRKAVQSASIQITAPSVGATPSFNPTVTGTDFTLDVDNDYFNNGVFWYDETAGYEMEASDVFEAGHKYSCEVILVVNDGYRFNLNNAEREAKLSLTNITFNSKKAYAEYDAEYDASNVYAASRFDGALADVTYIFDELAGQSTTFTVRGTVKSYLDDTDDVIITLLKKVGYMYVPKKTITLGDWETDYILKSLTKGQYVIKVSKKNHVDRIYYITVNGNMTKNLEINPIGDVNGDGDVTMKDYGKVYKHVQELESLSGYALQCGDTNNDDDVTMKDYGAIYKHVQEIGSVWE